MGLFNKKPAATTNQDVYIRPPMDWQGLFSTAPYFTSALNDALNDDIDERELPPLYLAGLYFNTFDGEICNGGVSQYFYNQADYLPNFDRVPELLAAHPVLAPIMPMVNTVHRAWQDCAADVRAAREADDWPEQLFKQYASVFEQLENDYYAINQEVSQRLAQHIVQHAHDYFTMEHIAGVPDTGVAHISIHNNTQHFRFKNGFPVGPNVFEQRDGGYFMICFDDEINRMEYSDGTRQGWIHYPSLRSVDMNFYDDRHLELFKSEKAFWYRDGVREYFHHQGFITSSHIELGKDELCSRYFYPNGQLSLSIIKQKNGELLQRYWANGQPNTHALRDENWNTRYFNCFDEQGKELAPNGNGQLIEIFSEEDGERVWAQGTLVNGRLHGDFIRYSTDLATGKVTETQREVFNNGKQ